MLVLDYMRNTGDSDNPSQIIIPPFHSGHLGYIPPLDINMVLLSEAGNLACPCELVISSNEYQQKSNLALLECTMRDKVGLVNNIVSVLSKYQINILTMETTAHNHLNNHTLSIILDFKTSSLKAKKTYKSSQNLYKDYANLFPQNDYRYMKIFEDIMLTCHNEITWNNTFGHLSPQFSIRPMKDFGDYKFPEPSKIIAHKKLDLCLQIPKRIEIQLRNYLRVSDNEKLFYIMHSDTNERLLRIFFPVIQTTNNIFHLAFFHNDLPGAINCILDLLAISEFNILSSILRRKGDDKSVCEIIFEYNGAKKLSTFKEKEEKYRWVSEKLTSNLDKITRVRDFGFEIGIPQYPKLSKDYSACFKKFNGIKKENNLEPSNNGKILKANSILKSLKKQQDISLELFNKIDLISAIEERQNREDKPIIFLSYPSSAKELAKAFRKKFEELFTVEDYQKPDGKIIPDQVRSKIKQCDYFVGIWHEDEDFKSKEGNYATSPWMLFEYGIAFDDEKPVILLQSEKLDPKIAQRIHPSKAEIKYNDANFITTTLEEVESSLYEIRRKQVKLNESRVSWKI